MLTFFHLKLPICAYQAQTDRQTHKIYFAQNHITITKKYNAKKKRARKHRTTLRFTSQDASREAQSSLGENCSKKAINLFVKSFYIH